MLDDKRFGRLTLTMSQGFRELVLSVKKGNG